MPELDEKYHDLYDGEHVTSVEQISAIELVYLRAILEDRMAMQAWRILVLLDII